MSKVQDRSRGFSLVELLTVIAIIALVISIIIPVLGGARDAGRRVSTQGLLNDIANASSAFRQDHNGRNPGYFSEREMGSAENATRGMSGMENAMLDLGGSNAIVQSGGPGIVSVGPIASQAIFVNPNLVGADDGAYFKPSREYYVAQTSPGQQVGVAGHTSSSENDAQLLDVIDSFGQPVLFWSADTHTVPQARAAVNFAAIASGGAQPSMFYWNSNAAFLQATNLGRRGENMTTAPAPGQSASLIGSGASVADRERTLRALLGSASAPATGSSSTVDQVLNSPSQASIESLFPSRGRGAFVIHSAGRDGIYLSSKDRGFGSTNLSGNRLDYGMNFFQGITSRFLDQENRPSSRDVIAEFDDILVSGN